MRRGLVQVHRPMAWLSSLRRRVPHLVGCQVERLGFEGPSIRIMHLRPHTPSELCFSPGQWVDLFSPDLDSVGGYSILSAPWEVEEEGLFTLAVQASRHPMARWVHGSARVGHTVGVRVGGNFCYCNTHREPRPALLVAGGIGITPLLSMANHHVHMHPGTRATLVHSARSSKGFPFAGRIPGSPCFAYCTHASDVLGRLDRQSLEAAVAWRGARCVPELAPLESHVAYICGPPAMTDNVAQALRVAGLAEEDICFERWW